MTKKLSNKFTVLILGCQYNYYDAKNITHHMQKMGYIFTDDEKDADIVFVLSCSVRQKPVDRLFGKIKNWQKKKKKIILAGCVLDYDRKKFEKKEIVVVDQDKIIDYVKNNFQKISETQEISNYYFSPGDAEENTAFVPIMQGCNNFCTYCAVPYTRGREKSRDPKNIIREVKEEIGNNKNHIVLLGQNVNAYQNDNLSKNEKNAFTELLKMVDNLEGEFDYNFISPNPRNFSDELIDFLPKAKKWNKQLHLPLQSGNNEILKKMNRKYTVEQYLSIIERLRSKIKNLQISTDVIVGFPGETEDQYKDSYNLCEKIGFTRAFVAQYSPRPGTVAEKKYEDNIPRNVKKNRWEKLNSLVNT